MRDFRNAAKFHVDARRSSPAATTSCDAVRLDAVRESLQRRSDLLTLNEQALDAGARAVRDVTLR